MHWDVTGTRAGKSGRWKLEAPTQESAERKAIAAGISIRKLHPFAEGSPAPQPDYGLSGKGWTALIGLPVLAVLIGGWLAVRLARSDAKPAVAPLRLATAAKGATPQSTTTPATKLDTAAVKSSPLAPASQPNTPAPAIMHPARLVEAKASPQPPHVVAAQPPSDQPITIEEVDSFAAEFSKAAARRWTAWTTVQEAAHPLTSSGPTEHTDDFSVISTDLKRSDSLVYPIVGEITLKYFSSSSAKQINYFHIRNERWTMTIGRHGGRWKAIKATSHLEEESTVPHIDSDYSDRIESNDKDITGLVNTLIEERSWTEAQFRDDAAKALRRGK